jgi:hypothetical protein
VTSRKLERFGSEAAFGAYLKQLDQIRAKRKSGWIARGGGGVQYAKAKTGKTPCPPGQKDCPDKEEIIVTAHKSAATPSITNNQTAGVDEGDVVKQIGPFLLVLQDGRVFSIDTRKGLALASRANVYRDPKSDVWYDEMLVEGDRVIVTGYSYKEEATEISVLALDRENGTLRAEGVFLISSDDYYSVSNYATRIVGDRLIVYTPFEPERLLHADRIPVIRRWLPEAERESRKEQGHPLLDARDIYRPVQRTSNPVIHSISVCPLGQVKPGSSLSCTVTAFMAPTAAEMFVSPDDVFLWTWPGYRETGWTDECHLADRPARRDVMPASVFRLPLHGGEPGVAGISGIPLNQFSMDSQSGEFRALAAWWPFRCYPPDDVALDVAFLKLPHRLFATRFGAVDDARITPVPSPGTRRVENRFADDWVVYGGRKSWDSYPPDDEDGPQTARAVAVPIGAPEQARIFDFPHSILRIERVGNDMVLDGYHDDRGLSVTLLKLGHEPRIGSMLRLDQRYESEGRSHAFNSVVGPDGSGLVGIPTVVAKRKAGRWWWRSDDSDVSILTLSAAGGLGSAGALHARSGDPDPSYQCEVSCIDWYGNARPIFTDGRIFGLMGTELVEGRLDSGQISELQRLDLTRPPRGIASDP